MESNGLSRRDFLRGLGAAGLGSSLVLDALEATASTVDIKQIEDPLKGYPHRGWEDKYRKEYSFDKIVRTVDSTNCTHVCGWLYFVKEGVVVRAEQAADYPEKEYNPRGCMKGACALKMIYSPDRIKYPMIRVGQRGEGKWRRATWDEALEHVAKELKRIQARYGPQVVLGYPPIPGMSLVRAVAGWKFTAAIGATMLTFYDWYGDLFPTMPMTFGVQGEEHEALDWKNSRYILIFGKNSVETALPEAHFLLDARIKNGAKVVYVGPDCNGTAVRADLWLPIRPGTDTALALGMANVIVKEGLYDAEYISRFSVAPLLIRKDTGKYLREAEAFPGGSEDHFVIWCQTLKGPKVARSDSFDLGGARPALTGSYAVRGADGETIEVEPAFQRLSQMLSAYTPQTAMEITGIKAELIPQVAREYATTKPAAIHEGTGVNHWYHNDLSSRAISLLAILTGNIGKSGGGFSPWSGQYKIVPFIGFIRTAFSEGLPGFMGTAYFVEGPASKYRTSAYPPFGPKAMIIAHGNFLNQAKGQGKILKEIWPKLELVVTVDVMMTTTAHYSDVVLPACSWFEKDFDISCGPVHRYIQCQQRVIDPLWESKTDWEIFKALAEKMGVGEKFTTFTGLGPYDGIRFKLTRAEQVAQFILDNDPGNFTNGPHRRITVPMLKRGPVRYMDGRLDPAGQKPFVPFYDNIKHGKVFGGLQPTPAGRVRLPITGRMEFYKEEDIFLELGEELPVHKEPFEATPYLPNAPFEKAKAGGNPLHAKYPLINLSPHGRWSVHSTWRNIDWMVQLHAGGPRIEMNPSDAKARGIGNGEWVLVFNDRGRYQIRAKLTARIRPGTVLLYHGWWREQFVEGSWQETTSVPIKPTQEILFRPNIYAPSQQCHDSLVEVRRLEEVQALPSWYLQQARNLYWYDAPSQKENPYLPKKRG
jgi:anaerobic selenocysteine-containing dehydrogenase